MTALRWMTATRYRCFLWGLVVGEVFLAGMDGVLS